jgi:hypothetical protein
VNLESAESWIKSCVQKGKEVSSDILERKAHYEQEIARLTQELEQIKPRPNSAEGAA